MRAVVLATLLVPVTAFSGCLVCEVSGGCWALVGVYAYVDLKPVPTSERVASTLEAMGYPVDQRDPYIQASRVDDPLAPGEIISIRVHGTVAAPTGVDPPPGAVRLCIQYGDWSHHNTKDDAAAHGAAHAGRTASHAGHFSRVFAERIEATRVGELSWETHFHKQGQPPDGPVDEYNCF